MPDSLLYTILIYCLDSISSHLVLYFFLFAIADFQIRWKAIGKIFLVTIPVTAFVSYEAFRILDVGSLPAYAIASVITLIINSVMTARALDWDGWKAFSAICLAAALQVGWAGKYAPGIPEGLSFILLLTVIWPLRPPNTILRRWIIL